MPLELIITFKGGPGSGHHGHAGRRGHRGGSAATITMSSGTSDSEFADMMLDALDGKELGRAYPIVIDNTDTGQEIRAHILQSRIGGKISLSYEETKYGKPHQRFMSLSTKGKKKGKMRFESSDPQWLLEEQGMSKESGYLHR